MGMPSPILTATPISSCCVMLSLVAIATVFVGAGAGASGSRYSAIFNFGDSMSDTGNLCPDGRPSPAAHMLGIDHYPYGKTYFQRATCRCTDGRVIIDFIAQAVGLPFLPPSLWHGQDFRRGANMAVGGGTVLERSILQFLDDKPINASLSSQVDTFLGLLPSICGATGKNCKDYLAKSLFVFQIGENDYNVQLLAGSTIADVAKDIPSVVNNITSVVEKMIMLGAVDIVVSNIRPLGCFPMYLANLGSSNESTYDDYGCLKKHNMLFNEHNSLLQSSLSRLQAKHRRARIMYADLAGHIYQMVRDPGMFGFESGLECCCGDADEPYKFSFVYLCGTDGVTICSDPERRLSWDGMHFSDATNKWVADGWLHGPYCHPPILQ